MGKERSKDGTTYADDATTRSPADREIFGDEGAKHPAKDETPPRVDKNPATSEAGGVD
jgi:hypothetical protein